MFALLLLACALDRAPAAPVPTDAEKVARAVELGAIVKADPENAEAALTAKGSSAEELEALLFDIAADPAMSDAYAEALGEDEE